MRLWHVECVVQDNKLYDLMLHLESIKAYNVKNVVFANGKGEESAPQGPKVRSKDQTNWILSHVKDGAKPGDLRPDWEKAGFIGKSLYGTLTRLIKQKRLKKMADGTYKLTGA